MAISNEIQENKPENKTNVQDVKINYGSTQVLKIIMYNGNNEKFTWNVKYPETSARKTIVERLVDNFVTNQFLIYKNSPIAGLDDAYIYETSTIEIPSA